MYSIYVVFSSTPNRIGRMIRRVTKEEYNHASIALDSDLTRMYSFARRYYRTPLYGGFVRESRSRYHQEGQASIIRICKIPVTEEQYKNLEQLLGEMEENHMQYLYNHLSALFAVFHKRIRAKDAYTCIEFCIRILHSVGVDVDPSKHYTVCQLEQMLRPLAVYTGPIPAGEYDAAFYATHPVPYPFCTTVRDMFRVLPRLGK